MNDPTPHYFVQGETIPQHIVENHYPHMSKLGAELRANQELIIYEHNGYYSVVPVHPDIGEARDLFVWKCRNTSSS